MRNRLNENNNDKDTSLEKRIDNKQETRLPFLDNIRWLIILFVILHHVALIYVVWDGDSDTVRSAFKLIISLTDVFMMPMMFFIAGFLALPSIRQHGLGEFLIRKFKRIW